MSSAQLVFKRYETKYLLDAGHPAFKEKTRTCRYGTPHPFDPVFVELKKNATGPFMSGAAALTTFAGVGRTSRDGQSRLFKRRPRARRRRHRRWPAAGRRPAPTARRRRRSRRA